MPAGSRIRANNVFGSITDNPLTSGSTTFNSGQLPLLPAVAGNHAVLTFDPLRQFGEPEIVVVTAHTAASTTATITRGAYGTTARAHPQGTIWVHAPIDEDVVEILTSSTRPTDPYNGQIIHETDKNRWTSRLNGTWIPAPHNPPHCAVRHNSDQTHTNNGGWETVGFNTEDEDTDSMHDTVTNNPRITVPVAGIYLLTACVEFAANATGVRATGFRKNSSGTNAPNIKGRWVSGDGLGGGSIIGGAISSVVKLVATDYVEVVALQNSGGNLVLPANAAEQFPYFTVTWVGVG